MNSCCPIHKIDIVEFCIESSCSSRCVCKECQHPHKTLPIKYLIDNVFIKEVNNMFQIFKGLMQKMLISMEQDIFSQLSQIKIEQHPLRITELSAFLSRKLQIHQQIKNSIESKLKRIIDAILVPTTQSNGNFIQSLNSIPQFEKIEHKVSKPSSPKQTQNKEPQDFEMNKLQLDLILDKLEVERLKNFNQDQWPWKMGAGAIFVISFVPLRKFTLLGFKQPILYKSDKVNYQKSSVNYNYGLFNKKNLLKPPLIKEYKKLRHSQQQIIDRCYNILFDKPIKLKEGKEYSIAIWSNNDFYCHYYSVPSDPNQFVQFQQQDFNDHPKIKREETVPQVISTFRAGLIPALIIDPRLENN